MSKTVRNGSTLIVLILLLVGGAGGLGGKGRWCKVRGLPTVWTTIKCVDDGPGSRGAQGPRGWNGKAGSSKRKTFVIKAVKGDCNDRKINSYYCF